LLYVYLFCLLYWPNFQRSTEKSRTIYFST
jgi:hypothetical protein